MTAPTSEERREGAARLRNLAGHRAADEELTLDALGLYRGENIEGYDTYGVMHLADLIDPTCHIEDDDWASQQCMGPMLSCDRCGNAFPEINGPYQYCPCCGARVVERSED